MHLQQDLKQLPAPDASTAVWLDHLLQIMALLRSPQGCPWVRQQTHASLTPYLHEEAYEVDDAIATTDPEHLCDELGDILLQVIFHSAIATESGQFTMGDVIKTLTRKLLRRHPHVFNATDANQDLETIAANWEAIKRAEQQQAEQHPHKNDSLPLLLQLGRVIRKWRALQLPAAWLTTILEQSLPTKLHGVAHALVNQCMQDVNIQHHLERFLKKLIVIVQDCQQLLHLEQHTWLSAPPALQAQCRAVALTKPMHGQG